MECSALDWIKMDLDALQWQAPLKWYETLDFMQDRELSWQFDQLSISQISLLHQLFILYSLQKHKFGIPKVDS